MRALLGLYADLQASGHLVSISLSHMHSDERLPHGPQCQPDLLQTMSSAKVWGPPLEKPTFQWGAWRLDLDPRLRCTEFHKRLVSWSRRSRKTTRFIHVVARGDTLRLLFERRVFAAQSTPELCKRQYKGCGARLSLDMCQNQRHLRIF